MPGRPEGVVPRADAGQGTARGDLAGRPYWLALAVVLITVPPVTFLAMKYWGVRGEGSWH